jgi:hypothetical protein
VVPDLQRHLALLLQPLDLPRVQGQLGRLPPLLEVAAVHLTAALVKGVTADTTARLADKRSYCIT